MNNSWVLKEQIQKNDYNQIFVSIFDILLFLKRKFLN